MAEDDVAIYAGQQRTPTGAGRGADPQMTQPAWTDPIPGGVGPVQAGSPTPPGWDASMGVNASRMGIPNYMGFAQVFRQQYADATPTAMQAVDDLWSSLNHLFSRGDPQNNASWQDAAYEYDYNQFLRDAAVVIAARGGKGREQASPPKEKEPKPAAPTGGAPRRQ